MVGGGQSRDGGARSILISPDMSGIEVGGLEVGGWRPLLSSVADRLSLYRKRDRKREVDEKERSEAADRLSLALDNM